MQTVSKSINGQVEIKTVTGETRSQTHISENARTEQDHHWEFTKGVVEKRKSGRKGKDDNLDECHQETKTSQAEPANSKEQQIYETN